MGSEYVKIEESILVGDLSTGLSEAFSSARRKASTLAQRWSAADGSPVITRDGIYGSRGWTEWTQGFQFGIPLLIFDATGDEEMLALGMNATLKHMPAHLTHMGVHDHGFNTISTYGNLWRMQREGKIARGESSEALCELAIRVSGAVQASRWTTLHDGTGFIHSFNGPHSLFSDTIRSLRVLVLAHRMGQTLMGENDRKISLLQRAIEHLNNTIQYNVYFGDGRDAYDERGRVAHESIFNVTDGRYRCPSTQQGYSPFTTWTRGLAWILLGCAELLEFFDGDDGGAPDVDAVRAMLRKAAEATAEFYIANTATDGVTYWDIGAPGLAYMPNWREQPACVDNAFEPVDSSAAAIAAQGLLRLGESLGDTGGRYTHAGLTVAGTLFSKAYLSRDDAHEGLLLHSVYHRPNGWDHTPHGKHVPQGESSMWGDYHLLELALYLHRLQTGEPYLNFFGGEVPRGGQSAR